MHGPSTRKMDHLTNSGKFSMIWTDENLTGKETKLSMIVVELQLILDIIPAFIGCL